MTYVSLSSIVELIYSAYLSAMAARLAARLRKADPDRDSCRAAAPGKKAGKAADFMWKGRAE